MSAIPVETTEPDPAATSLPNDEPVNKDGGDPSAPTDEDTVNADAEAKPLNGAAEAKQEPEVKEEVEVKAEETNKKKWDGHKRKERVERTYEDGVLKTSATNWEGENNSRYNPKVLPVSDDPKLIRAQVEFYFSDSNLPTDDFLWKQTEGTENKPVPIFKICNFGRMKRFQPRSAVVAALRESDFLVVSGPEGEEAVNRKVPYDPTTPVSKSEARSVYAKGFGDEDPSSQFDIEAFFAPYGPTRSVRLRRTEDKLFKGSVFVEFQDEETAKKFLDLETKPLWKGKHVLKIESKRSYVEKKEQEIKDGKIEPQPQRSYDRGRGRGRGGRGNNRGNNRGKDRGERRENRDRDPDDWKKRREEDRASGFKDNRNHNNQKGDRRGGRDGGNRGGRGRRDDRGPRDRNQEREDKDKEVKGENGEKPESDKRAREEENGVEDKPSKKVDIKSEAQSEEVTSNGQKRAREDDGGAEENPAKKIDTKPEIEA